MTSMHRPKPNPDLSHAVQAYLDGGGKITVLEHRTGAPAPLIQSLPEKIGSMRDRGCTWPQISAGVGKSIKTCRRIHKARSRI